MKNTKEPSEKITATYARNNFFGLVHDVYINNGTYAIEKNGILMGYIISPKTYHEVNEDTKKEERKEQQLAVLERLAELRSMQKSSGEKSEEIIRKMREDRINHLARLSGIK